MARPAFGRAVYLQNFSERIGEERETNLGPPRAFC